MEAVILCGIQASGKSTFCRERLFATHVRINLDMLKTRHREEAFLRACLEAKQPFVVDNTNPTRQDRQRYIERARDAKFKVVGYYFESRVSGSLERNATRSPEQRISEAGVKSTAARLEIPSKTEGFDELYYVKLIPEGFEIQAWNDEV